MSQINNFPQDVVHYKLLNKIRFMTVPRIVADIMEKVVLHLGASFIEKKLFFYKKEEAIEKKIFIKEEKTLKTTGKMLMKLIESRNFELI